MLLKPKRIGELQILIEKLNQDVQESQSKAKAYYEHGKRYAQKLSDYFTPLLRTNNNQLKTLLTNTPVSTCSGWNSERWQTWDASSAREETVLRIGDLTEPRRNGEFFIPAYIPFIGQGKTVIIKSGGNPAQGSALLQSLVVRTALMLPHQTRYTLLDPAGAGIAFPMRRYLPQVQDSTGDVRRDLDQVVINIQRIIETYLDASITSFECVPQEIRINERFGFVFAADFPNQYDRRAIEALQSIGNTGCVAGTYLFIHYNQNYELPRDMSMDGFKNAFYVDAERGGTFSQLNLKTKIDPAPSADLQAQLFQKLKDAKPPERILDWDNLVGVSSSDWWQEKSIKVIETPVGARGGVDKLKLWFGINNDSQPCAHGMLGAMTGSGKSNLYHVFISGLAVRYSPEELRLYLIDGKDGVEFQPYRHLPHAEVVSLRSSPELSRSVLAELITEKERRNSIFARVGVNDLASYRTKGEPEGKLPRILLLVDEYQELFESDKEGTASNYLLQLSQQGRSAGIHMLLASQRFGAAGMLNQTGIFGNLHLLMAMQMKTADIQALTEFGRRGKALIATCDLPGKIVINDKGGDDNANVAGKVAYLRPDRRDEILRTLIEKANSLSEASLPRRVVFNGRSQPSLTDNPYLASLLRRTTWPTSQQLEAFARKAVETGGLGIVDWFSAEHPRVVWLGQQFNVRGQAMVVFRRRVAENALIVGGTNAARYGMLAALIASLSVNTKPVETEFVIFDKSIVGSQWSSVLQTVYESVLLPAGFSAQFSRETNKVESYLNSLISELDRRRNLSEEDMAHTSSIFAIMTELDGIEAIRRKGDSYGGMADSPLGEKLRRLYLEGSPLGIHLILSFAGVRPMANVIDERRGIINFRHRVALQMSEDESHTFARSRKASQLQVEGPTPICALYVDLENDKSVRFKPYSSDASTVAQNESLIDQLRIIGQGLTERKNHQ
jgi:DNA segregation ATPase FtsK/SpoIIIE, S-DNA-T family